MSSPKPPTDDVEAASVPAVYEQTAALFKEYPASRYIRLLPSLTIADVETQFVNPAREIVKIDPTLDVYENRQLVKRGGGEVYRDRRMPPGHVALGRRALQKLQHAAGLVFPPDLNGLVSWDKRGAHYKAAVAGKKADGSLLVVTASKVVDLELEEMKIRDQQLQRLNTDEPTPAQLAKVEATVRHQMIQVRENMVQNAETKAQNRAIRKWLALKDSYPQAELEKPFVLIRFDSRLDPSDPAQANLIAQQAAIATGQLYRVPGPPPGEPVAVVSVSDDSVDQANLADEAPAADPVDELDDALGGEDPGPPSAVEEIAALGYEGMKERFKEALRPLGQEQRAAWAKAWKAAKGSNVALAELVLKLEIEGPQ